MTATATKPPEGLGKAGSALWVAVTAEYDLEQHELLLLREASRTADLLDELDRVVRAQGAITSSPQGERANPAAVESRQQRIAFARLLVALRLPSGEEGEEDRRPQRRGGTRGVYGFGGAA